MQQVITEQSKINSPYESSYGGWSTQNNQKWLSRDITNRKYSQNQSNRKDQKNGFNTNKTKNRYNKRFENNISKQFRNQKNDSKDKTFIRTNMRQVKMVKVPENIYNKYQPQNEQSQNYDMFYDTERPSNVYQLKKQVQQLQKSDIILSKPDNKSQENLQRSNHKVNQLQKISDKNSILRYQENKLGNFKYNGLDQAYNIKISDQRMFRNTAHKKFSVKQKQKNLIKRINSSMCSNKIIPLYKNNQQDQRRLLTQTNYQNQVQYPGFNQYNSNKLKVSQCKTQKSDKDSLTFAQKPNQKQGYIQKVRKRYQSHLKQLTKKYKQGNIKKQITNLKQSKKIILQTHRIQQVQIIDYHVQQQAVQSDYSMRMYNQLQEYNQKYVSSYLSKNKPNLQIKLQAKRNLNQKHKKHKSQILNNFSSSPDRKISIRSNCHKNTNRSDINSSQYNQIQIIAI